MKWTRKDSDPRAASVRLRFGKSCSMSSLLEVLILIGTLITLCSCSHIPSSLSEQIDNELEAAQHNKEIPIKEDATTRAPISSFAAPRRHAVLSATCDNQLMTVRGVFGEKFRGRIYAYDYSDELDCGVTASPEATENITLHLPLGQCGIQMLAIPNNAENPLRHDVTLYIQYSSVLQQSIDEKATISCFENKNATEELKLENLSPAGSAEELEEKPISRQGRRLKHFARNSGLPRTTTKIGEALMEIISGKDPSPKSKQTRPVAVGNDVTLIISTKVLRGYDARIVNCTTHDGSRHTSTDGSRVQPILDSAGCSVDRGLVPNFRRRRLPVESRNRLITLHFASFPAFKFPERDHLHIKCTVVYWQGPCPQESCDSGTNHYGTWRDKYGRIADVLVETSQVVNAIEVLSPELHSQGAHHYDRHQSSLPVGTVTAGAGPSLAEAGAAGSYTEKLSPAQQPANNAFSNRASSLSSGNSNSNYSPGNGPSSIYGNNPVAQVPSPTMSDSAKMQSGQNTNNSVCISPGTIILALVILGVVLVISITVTLWFALKRAEAKKYGRPESVTTFSNPGPAPYYRFSQHW